MKAKKPASSRKAQTKVARTVVAKTKKRPAKVTVAAPVPSSKPAVPKKNPSAARRSLRAKATLAAPVPAPPVPKKATPTAQRISSTKPRVTPPPPPVAAKPAALPKLPVVNKSAPVAKLAVTPKSSLVAKRMSAAKPRKTAAPSRLVIPPLLLEGDFPAPPSVSGTGRRYVLGPVPPSTRVAAEAAELPESYGTKELFLTARDPRWLYAHWDFTTEQLQKSNALSSDGHLRLRVFRNAISGEPLLQIHLHPESRHWFVPAPYAGAKYLATLGYGDGAGKWIELARSAATMTPLDSVAHDGAVRFATIPLDVPFVQLLDSVAAAVRENLPLAEALQELRAGGFSSLPEPAQIAGTWTPAQEKALADVVSIDETRRIWIGSVEITELIRRQIAHDISSVTAAQFGQAAAGPSQASSPAAAFGGPSSPSGGPARARGFWFNVNAELIIYGATEPDAKVTIGGRQIKLRRDGSFSFRFALPDGQYALPAEAQSADGEETRAAELKFSRQSEYRGGVEKHPQDEKLQPPVASAVA